MLGENVPTHLQGGRLDYACLLNMAGMQATCALVTELISDHFALHVELPVSSKHLMGKRKRLVMPQNFEASFVLELNKLYQNYKVTTVDQFYADLTLQIEAIINTSNKNTTKQHRGRKNNYTRDKNVQEWNKTLKLAHRRWVVSGNDLVPRKPC